MLKRSDLINIGPGKPSPFVQALAQAISDALPLVDHKIPMTDDGVAFLRRSVEDGLDLFLSLMAEDRMGP